MTPRVKVWLQWLAGIYQAAVHRRGSRVRPFLRVRIKDADWPSLALRLAAVGAVAAGQRDGAIKPPFDLQLRVWRERS